MTVKAEVDSVSYSLAPVHFEVSTITPTIPDIKFSKSYYSVVVSDNLNKEDKIFDLSVVSPKAAQYIMYNISGKNHYFSIHEYFGTLTLKRNLSELNLAKNSSKKFEFTVVARLRGSTAVAASAIIHVIVIPAYSGDTFDHLVETTDSLEDRLAGKEKQAKRSEFSFHRFFRQLSPIAQNISKAEMKFNRIIRGLRESVVDEFTGRSNTLNKQITRKTKHGGTVIYVCAILLSKSHAEYILQTYTLTTSFYTTTKVPQGYVIFIKYEQCYT